MASPIPRTARHPDPCLWRVPVLAAGWPQSNLVPQFPQKPLDSPMPWPQFLQNIAVISSSRDRNSIAHLLVRKQCCELGHVKCHREAIGWVK